MVHRVAIYARVSTNDQSCERQLSELEGYAVQNNFEIVGTFKEIGSGTKNNRSERKKILELARLRKIDMVLVSELSRWGRSTPDLRTTVERLSECSVALRALNGPELDISTAQGKLLFTSSSYPQGKDPYTDLVMGGGDKHVIVPSPGGGYTGVNGPVAPGTQPSPENPAKYTGFPGQRYCCCTDNPPNTGGSCQKK